ncbi:MAG: ABC transporter permease [Candidatus Aminicenantes bacterium]|nr:ABC transporter permease [Candidatus Aminicenantes bacterium]
MFKNYLVVAWRTIVRNKAYSALNILGLAVGLSVFILIMLFVRTETSYDRYHANGGNIYRVVQEQPGNVYLGSNVFAVTPGPLAAAMVRDFPEVLEATRIDNWGNVLVRVGEKSFMEDEIHWTDPQTFEIFSFPIVRGEGGSALTDPFSVLLSENAAGRFFGGADPIGRTIAMQAFEMDSEFRVAGVFRDIPANSHFTMDVVAPFETMGRIQERDLTRWGNNSFYTYVLLQEGSDPKALEEKLVPFIAKYEAERGWTHEGRRSRYFLQALTGIHRHSRANFDFGLIGDGRFVLLFASIAVLVLAIACVNYMNLATARSLKRAKEVGLRKVVGAGQGQLVRQFLGDAMVLTFMSLTLAVGFVLAALPAFRRFVERDIAFDPFRDAVLMPALILLAAVVGGIAGSYPALFVSGFRPVAALKGTGATRAKGRGLRNGLIVFQFAASIALIICTVVVGGQLAFIRNTDMGYDRDQILVLTPLGGARTGLEAFKNELRSNPGILSVASSSCLPNNVTSSTHAQWPGRPEDLEIPIYVVEADYDFPGLYGLELAAGRSFSRDFPSDAGGAYLINEAAQKALGWDDPLGREFGRKGPESADARGRIVGVLKDFHMHSLHLSIMPLYVFLDPARSNRVSIKLRGGDIPAALASARRAWEKVAPEYPFEYAFFDEIFDRAYRVERRLGTMFSAFAGLAVLIACLGLLGLASFTAEQKTKEIGIRKVLGASSSGIIVLLSRDFMKWVVVANVVAWPVGYFAMRSWLSHFAYRIDLTVPMFLGAALAAFAIAAAVIGLQTYRAASANPAESMRYE